MKAHVEYEITDISQTNYTFSFPYLKKEFVKVSIKSKENNTITNLTYGINYLVLLNLSITLVPDLHLKVGDILIIERKTSTDSIVSWTDASILIAKDLTLEQTQMLHLMEEQEDYLKLNSINSTPTASGEKVWNANNSRITNVGNPKEPLDAVNKGYMESVSNDFVSRNTTIENNIRDMQSDVSSKKDSVDTAVTEVKKVETSVKASEASVRQDKETVKTLLDNGKTTITEAVNEGKTTIKTMVDTAKEYDSTAKQSAISASSSADMSHKWAVATDSPDGLADSGSTTGKTMSSRSWALQAKTSGTAAEQAKNDANSYAGTAKSNADKAISEAAKATSASQTATGAATKATTEADRAKAEADRAAGIAGGNFLSLDNGGTVKGKTIFTQNVTLNGTPSADNDGTNKKYVDDLAKTMTLYIQKNMIPKVTVEDNTIAFGNVKIGVD